MPPAARISDMHVCPMVTGVVPHVGGPIMLGEPTVMIGMMPAARMGDMCVCAGPPDTIAKGSPTVFIGKKLAARMGDMTMHGGAIVFGLPTVMIGEAGAGIASAVNPMGSVINCGNIVHAVIDRLTGVDPNATAPDEQNGTFAEIGERHGTDIQFGQSMDDAFAAVQNGGDGTIAIVGIKYKDSDSSHVVVMTNTGGTVSIIEGQDWGPGNPQQVISSPADAKSRYGADSDIGIGILPK